MSFGVERDEIALVTKAKRVYDWYKDWLQENIEPETQVMQKIDLKRPEGRFELIILARLFNNYIAEDKAIEYFQMFKSWFMEKGFSYKTKENVGMISFAILNNVNHETNREFKNFMISKCPKTPTFELEENYGHFVANAMAFSKEDLLHYINETNDGRDLLDVITSKLIGIKVKSFLIVREMYKAGLWSISKANLWMCCVPDSKVRKFLDSEGFIPNQLKLKIKQHRRYLDQLKEYSRIVWRYLNEPFDEHYFDLPIFRYVKENI